MAEKKPSGFRFRLPWLLQPSIPRIAPRTREPPTQPPRTTTTQTSQKPPFRPPGKAPPSPPPPTVATPAPFSPRRSPLQSAASSPPASVSPKSTVPKPPTAKTSKPVESPHANKTRATTETVDPSTLPQTPPFSPPKQADSQPSPPQISSPSASESTIAKINEPVAAQPAKETQTTTETIQTVITADHATPPLSQPPSSVSPGSSVPESSPARTTEPIAAQPAKEAQTATVTADPESPPLSPPQSVSPNSSAPESPTIKDTEPVAAQPAKEAQTTTVTADPESPPLSPPPSISPKSSAPESPTTKTTEPVAAQPTKETQTILTADPTTPPLSLPLSPLTLPQSQLIPPQTPPPPSVLPKSSVPESPTAETTKPIASQPAKQTNKIIPTIENAKSTAVSKITKLTEITNPKPMNSHSVDSGSQKAKLRPTIKDHISKFVQKISTKASLDETPTNVITVAGDNTGALMHMCLDENKTAIINEDKRNKEPHAIVNSNFQGINNSMMFESSVTEGNPGVHLRFYSDVANVDELMVKNAESTEMQRAEVNVTTAQNLVYEPIMGRYPEGVSMEASEYGYDDDDPQTSGKSYEIEVL